MMASRKVPNTALHCILRHCDVPKSTPHSSGFARLVFEPFRLAILWIAFFEIKNDGVAKSPKYPKGTSFGAHTSFVTATYPKVRLIPQDLRALSLSLFA